MTEEIIKPPGQSTKAYVPNSVAEIISLADTLIKHLLCFRHNARLKINKRSTLALEKYEVIKTKSNYIIFRQNGLNRPWRLAWKNYPTSQVLYPSNLRQTFKRREKD